MPKSNTIYELNRELLGACKLALTLLGTDEEAKNGCPSPEELAQDLRTIIAKAEHKPKYNTMCDVGFTIEHNYEDPCDIPIADLINALRKRAEYLEEHPNEAVEAFGFLDTISCCR